MNNISVLSVMIATAVYWGLCLAVVAIMGRRSRQEFADASLDENFRIIINGQMRTRTALAISVLPPALVAVVWIVARA